MGDKVTFHEVKQTESTNSLAKQLACDGVDHLTVVWAHQQFSGRGRYGRQWISPVGNVFWSMILRPSADWPSLSGLSHVAALAVHATITSLVSQRAQVQIKWPNDVLVNGKKIAGILLEAKLPAENMSSLTPESSLSGWVVVGVGINVMHFPNDVNYPATSLHAEGVIDTDRDQVIAALTCFFVKKLASYVEKGPSYLNEQLLPLMAGLGDKINVRVSDNADDDVVGIYSGLDGQGQLIVTKENGEQQTISTGDVFFGLKDR